MTVSYTHLDVYKRQEEREVKGMKKDMDKIQFEYRYEVQELMKVIDKYVKPVSYTHLDVYKRQM